MYRLFYEQLTTGMYPTRLLHSFAVNGKISGSIGACGEIGGNIAAVLHSPIGCGYHYRFSARRRHQPFYRLYCSDLTEQEIIFGGTDKLMKTCIKVWEELHPQLIMIIPSPISDVLNEDIRYVADNLRSQNIPVIDIKSELFSHRDKNYTKNRLKELSRQKVGSNNKLEIELKGCGFTEALYALVDQVMEPQKIIPRSVNIETVGWGNEGNLVLREIEAFLNKCGITVNTWIPSGDIEKLKKAPAAELNLVKRIRWAKKMQQKFGTDYLFLNNPGRYEGLDGIALFYREIAEKLQMADAVLPEIEKAANAVSENLAPTIDRLSTYKCCLVCRGMRNVPFELKTYAHDFSVQVDAVVIRLTESMKLTSGINPEVEENLLNRIHEAISLYAPQCKVYINPTDEEIRRIFKKVHAVVGTDDFSLEGKGAPLIPSVTKMNSISFESYVRNTTRFLKRLENAKERSELVLNRMPFDTENHPRIETPGTKAARQMWELMWLDRRKEENI